MNFTLQSMIDALNTLAIGTVYKYASVERASTGSCELVSVDQHTGAIKYKRNRVGTAPEANTKIESITGANVAKLATALNSQKAVEINALYGGSGNFRSALEALVANTANIFVCQIDGKKHIFWNPNHSHPVGQITVADAPMVYVPTTEDDNTRPDLNNLSRQLIIYGAPGTGKSWRIKNDTQGMSVLRTTFHPDSDYSTFVGAYKPSMEDVPRTFMKGEEIAKVTKGDECLFQEKRIVYKFVAQAFLKAYVAAWKKMADAADSGQGAARPTVCLVIEEINRGNCAQIFGDLFQLLDRDDYGFSDYEIAADEDLRRYLAEAFKGVRGADAQERVPPEVAEKLERIFKGEILLLPPNLYIWATMNTSDQSLFPIDSAFKRRWAWKYIPISNAGKNYSIEVGGDKYDWWTFLEKANDLVQSFTESEDKKLGYFFCKADRNGVISLEQFVGKVVFYLWNGVFKDTGFDDEVFDDGKGGKLYFKRFFDAKGDPNPESVRLFMKNLGVGAVASSVGNAEGADEGATTEPPVGGAENMEGQGQ